MTTVLQEGDPAPSFTATDQDGQPVSLADYKGKKLALFFYPQDDTPTCTKEACNLRDGYARLRRAGISVLGVSIDTEKKHRKFATKYQLPFRLVADPDRTIVSAYGVWGWKKFMGREFMGTHRVTFLINGQGRIDHIIGKVVSGDHTEQILQLWKKS